MPFPTAPLHTAEWFDDCFKPSLVPADLRQASEAVCTRFNIRGICDPMYIANVLAFELGRGTGESKFHAASAEACESVDRRLRQAALRLCFSYLSCIGDTPDATDGLTTVLRKYLAPRATTTPA